MLQSMGLQRAEHDLATEQQGQIVLWYVKHKRGGRRKGGKKYKVVLEDS